MKEPKEEKSKCCNKKKKWIPNGGKGYYRCSKCGKPFEFQKEKYFTLPKLSERV